MDLPIRSEWLADLLDSHRDLITECWIQDIRAQHIPGYEHISDERLRLELPPTVDSMVEAIRSGDTEGPRRHSVGVIRRRLADGFQLPDLQMSLHSLESAAMRVVKGANLGPEKEAEACQVAGNLYFLVALIAAAVYEQLRVEQQKRFATAYEFGIALSLNLDLGATLDTAAAEVAGYIGARSASILLAEDDSGRDELRAFHNLDPELAQAMPSIAEAMGCGAVDPTRPDVKTATCAVPDVRVDGRLAEWSELLVSHGCPSLVCAPLVAKQRRLGTLVVLWSDVQAGPRDELDFLFAMAGHIANAVQNAVLYEDAKRKQELAILLDASRLFGSSLDTQDILHKIARMSTEAMRADMAIVFADSAAPAQAHTAFYVRTGRVRSAFPRMIEAVIAEGEEAGFRSLGPEFAEGRALLCRTGAEFPGPMRGLVGQDASALLVPLRQKEALVGAFAVVSLAQNAFGEDDLLLATALADLAGVAIENARVYERERNISETLQRSFLPSVLPEIAAYEAAAYYRPAMAEAEIGGDFYDVFASGSGEVSVVMGDVSGKGLKSAIPTAMAKYIVRAYAAEHLPPSSVIARFNRFFAESAPGGLFMTAIYGVLDSKENTLTFVSAGHDPPLLYSRESGEVQQSDVTGICLGVTESAEYSDQVIRLQPGDALLLYTDGATDVKGDSGRLGGEGLRELFRSSANGSAEDIVRAVSHGIWEYSRGRLPDDVALVVLKRV